MSFDLLCDNIYKVYFVLSSANFATISANLNSIPVLNGTNFKGWKENVLIILGCMDLDIALRIEHPPSPTDSSSSKEKKFYEKWERLNRMSLMTIKPPETHRGVVFEEVTNAKQFLIEIEKRCAKSDEVEISIILHSLTPMKYNGKGSIRGYIMEMSHIVSKLKTLKI